MLVELDSWCPVCDRQVIPKCVLEPYEEQIPIDQPMVAPTAPVSPPRKSSRGARNAKPVHTSSRARAAAAGPHFKTVTRHRLVVEDADVPLYCSTECKLRDGQARAGLPMRYDPHSDFAEISHSTLMPALRRTDTDGSLTSSCGSDDSTDASPLLTFARAPPSYGREKHQRDMERVEKIKATAARQGLPNGKVAYAQVKPELYRSVVYGLTTPLVDHTGNELLTGPDAEEHAMAPYRSQISTARRSSVGIVSSATRDVQGPRPSPTRTVFEPSSAPTISSWPRSESDQDLLSGFHATLGRRSQSRCNLYSLSSSPTSPTSPTSQTSLSELASSTEGTSSKAFGFGRSRHRRMSLTPADDRPRLTTLDRSYSTSMVPFREESEELLYDAIPIPNSVNRMRTYRKETRLQCIDGVEKQVEVRVPHVVNVPVAPKTLFGPHRVVGPPLPSASA